MIWFLLLTRASELYLVPFLLLNVYRYVCTFDTEDMTTGTGTCNSVLGTLPNDCNQLVTGTLVPVINRFELRSYYIVFRLILDVS